MDLESLDIVARAQSRLNVATFDADTEIVALTDYAAVYEMKGKRMRKRRVRASFVGAAAP